MTTPATFIATNGIELEVFMAGDPHSDRLALCLHGFPEHAHSWRFQMPLLAELGYRVWAPNMRGYGHSARPPNVRDYAIESLLADVAGLIDAAAAREVVLLAHDWGAVIAWQFAMQKVRPLDRLVIMNVPHPEPFSREVRRWPQLSKSWYVFVFQIPWLPEWAMGRSSVGELFRRTARHPENFSDEDLAIFSANAATTAARRAMINYYRAMLRGGGASRSRKLGYSRIEVPTLLLWGEDDMALTKATTYGTERHVADLTIRYLPGISHWVQQDAPETVNAMLEAWLTGRPVPEMTPERRSA